MVPVRMPSRSPVPDGQGGERRDARIGLGRYEVFVWRRQSERPSPSPGMGHSRGLDTASGSQVSVSASELEMRGAERRTHSEKLEGGVQNKPQFGVRMR